MAGRARWHLLLYALLETFVNFRTTSGTILCVCSTPHCRQLKITTCEASAFCYTQYHELTFPSLTRGCIDDKTPILCENRPPEGVNGPWPVLHCCKDSMCNKDALPSIPSGTIVNNTLNIDDHTDRNNGIERPTARTTPTTRKYYTGTTNTVDEYSRKNPNTLFTLNVNPILIAVPLAGACALVAIAVFAVFILRKKDYTTYQRTLQSRHITKAPQDAIKGSKYSVALSDPCSECSQSKLLSHV